MSVSPHVKLVIKAAVTMLFFGVLAKKIDIATVGERLDAISIPFALLAMGLIVMRNVATAARWGEILRSLGHRLSLMDLTRYCFIGIFFNQFLPSSVGGDLARGYYLYSRGIGKIDATISVLLDRLIALVALALLCLAALATLRPSLGNLDLTVPVLVAMCGCAGLMLIIQSHLSGNIFLLRLFPAKLTSRLTRLQSRMASATTAPGFRMTNAKVFALSVVSHLFGISSAYFMARALTPDVLFLDFLALMPLVWIGSMLPVTIGGHGLRENLIILCFTKIGMPEGLAVSLSFCLLVQLLLQGAAGAIMFLLDKKRMTSKILLQAQDK